MDAALGTVTDENELRDLLFLGFGCAYDPTPHGLRLREWLTEMRRRILASLPAPPPERTAA